jgi:methylenetetrahydrofolate dehydrogenase (NADP+)/methenyltetrahydrofolate cyclohydrolase
MSVKILDGKVIAEKIKKTLKEEIATLKADHDRQIKLVSLQVGKNGGIESYLKSQEKLASELGIALEAISLDKDISSQTLLKQIEFLNNNKEVDAVILQRPLPKELDLQEEKDKLAFEQQIAAEKDAEGLHLKNLGSLFYATKLKQCLSGKIAPCTAQAVMEIIKSTQVELAGKEVVIIGHSKIIGKPLSLMLLNELATTTVCHIATKNIEEHVKRADILISAVGKPNLVKGSWIKEAAIVIDVGTSRVNGCLKGDVEFEAAKEKASYITPVPGGVGPLTTAMLMKNVVRLFINNHDKKNN